jgi:hypothetical protein
MVALIAAEAPDVAVIGLRLPGGGIQAVADGLAGARITCRLIGLATMPSPSAREIASRAGAQALVAKSDGAQIVAALTTPEG